MRPTYKYILVSRYKKSLNSPLQIQGYLGGGYWEVGRGGVPARGDAGRRIEVEEKEVRVREGFCD